MTMDFYGLKNAPMYGMYTNEKLNDLICTNMYICCGIFLLNPLQNA